MAGWLAGLRFPLPVEIDEATGIATLHPSIIRDMAQTFDPAWEPSLDTRAASTVAPPAATLTADVTAFLARQTTVLSRGMHLGARAITNATAELPFIQEVFRQLGGGSFDVALSFMDNLVNREIELLAAQQDGTAILDEIRAVFGAAPALLTIEQQASLDRSNLMLGLVSGVVATAPPASIRSRAEKTITIDTVKLDGSNHNPSTDIAIANAIYSQCNVRVLHGVNATATAAETTTWLGADRNLRDSSGCGSASPEERNMFQGAATAYGLNARFRAFFVNNIHTDASGYSVPPYCGTGAALAIRNMAVITNSGDTDTLAHELGHILINSEGHPALTIMQERPRLTLRISDTQCTNIYNNA